MTLDEFKKLLEKKHDMIQDEITSAKEQNISSTVPKERLILIDWIIEEANKIEITKPKMREFL